MKICNRKEFKMFGEQLPYIVLCEYYHMRSDVGRMLSTTKDKIEAHLKNEKGIGTLELIFITVIVLGMAVLFRNQISSIFKKIYEALQELNNNLNTDPLSQQNT